MKKTIIFLIISVFWFVLAFAQPQGPSGGVGGGDISGPGSSTDNAVPRFDGTSGDTLQDSGVIVDDTDNMTGVNNISPGGTVDGRDLATDGTKLDGVESSATADQSNAEIKTAYEANADTNEFSDAEQTKLGGIGTGADFIGPASSTDDALVRFNGAGGKTGQNSGAILDDSNNLTGVNDLTLGSTLITKLLEIGPDVDQAITAASDTISASSSVIEITPDADYVLTSTPSIATPATTEDQVLFIHNNSATFTVDIQDEDVLTGAGVHLGGAEGTIRALGVMTLIYSKDNSQWLVISNPNTASVGANAEILSVRNTSGGTITAGRAVYISGYNAGLGRPTIALADSDDPTKMPAVGITAASIGNNANGDVIMAGNAVSVIDTNLASVGDGVWIDETTPGEVVFARPTNNGIQRIGTVARSHATLGVVVVTGAGRANDLPIATGIIQVEDYGVVMGASGDQSTVLQAAFDAATAGSGTTSGDTVVCPQGTIELSTTVTIPRGVNFDGHCILLGIAGSDDQPLLVVGDNGNTENFNVSITGVRVIGLANAIWQKATAVGVLVYTCNNCRIEIEQAQWFTSGVQMYAIDGGHVFNHIQLNRIFGNKFGFDVIVDLGGTPTEGWFNDNIINGGNFQQGSTLNPGVSRYCFRFSLGSATAVATANTPDNNIFINPACEMTNSQAATGNPKAFGGGADLSAWAGTTSYSTGDYVTADGSIWIATSTGTSGATTLVGDFSVAFSDDTVTWDWVEPTQMGTVFLNWNGTRNEFIGVREEGNNTVKIVEYSNFSAIGGLWNKMTFGTTDTPKDVPADSIQFQRSEDHNADIYSNTRSAMFKNASSCWSSGRIASKSVGTLNTTVRMNTQGMHYTATDGKPKLISQSAESATLGKGPLKDFVYNGINNYAIGVMVNTVRNKRFFVRRDVDPDDMAIMGFGLWDGNPLDASSSIIDASSNLEYLSAPNSESSFTWDTSRGGNIKQGSGRTGTIFFSVLSNVKYVNVMYSRGGLGSMQICTLDEYSLEVFPGHGLDDGRNYLDTEPQEGYYQQGQIIYDRDSATHTGFKATTGGAATRWGIWTTATAYDKGQWVEGVSNTNIYEMTDASCASSGATIPTGTGTHDDGNCNWKFIAVNAVFATF